MTIWQSLFLGVLQGLTEFLPVSSSGHLILAGQLFDIPNDLAFDVFLHLGTLASVCLIMRKSISALFTKDHSRTLLMLILASIPTFAIALLVKLFIEEELLNKLLPIGFALTIVLLFLTHFLAKERISLKKRVLPQIICGVVQGVAVLPGLSRSGSTIATLSLFGASKEEATEFSFLLSIPVIAASGIAEGYTAFKSGFDTAFLNVLAGIFASFLVGCFAIALVKKLAVQNRLVYFAVYLFIPLLISLILL